MSPENIELFAQVAASVIMEQLMVYFIFCKHVTLILFFQERLTKETMITICKIIQVQFSWLKCIVITI